MIPGYNPNHNSKPKPTHQTVKVYPAHETERVHGTRERPLYCHVRGYYDRDQTKSFSLVQIPITFSDMGHPSDVVWTPSEAVVIIGLDFVWRGKLFVYPVGPELVKAGETLHLALGHMKLVDRFGSDVLMSGRSR